MFKILFFFLFSVSQILLLRGELWKQEVGSAMKIGLSTKGYKKVDLRCDAEHFAINVTLGDEFEGVVYTRGSFNNKKPPCFKRHNQSSSQKGGILITLRIPFNGCLTVMDIAESHYTNTLVVQHDPELIMPGDAAFKLDCAFVPEFKMRADITHGFTEVPLDSQEVPFKSKITLVDADPAENTTLDELNISVHSKNEKVSFIPNADESKDEL